MIANINFTIRLPYLKTEYELLNELGENKYDQGEWTWTFPLQHFKQVQTILGKKIEFLPLQAKTIKEFAPPKTESIILDEWKGKDKLEVIELPKIFKIITHRKQEDGKVKETTHEVNKELVKQVWNVILKQPINVPRKTSTVAKNIIESLGINRFHRETGSFDFAKFFGNRSDYHTYFYLPIKVLADYCVIKHYKSGMVERLSEEWHTQTSLDFLK